MSKLLLDQNEDAIIQIQQEFDFLHLIYGHNLPSTAERNRMQRSIEGNGFGDLQHMNNYFQTLEKNSNALLNTVEEDLYPLYCSRGRLEKLELMVTEVWLAINPGLEAVRAAAQSLTNIRGY
jgi:hypothetical protein